MQGFFIDKRTVIHYIQGRLTRLYVYDKVWNQLTKSAYFLKDTIDTEAERLCTEAVTERKHPLHFFLDRASLLITDLQEYFFNPGSHAFVPSAPAIIPGILALTERFIARRRPVILTRHLNNEKNAGMMKIWWNDLLTPDNPASQLIPEVRQLEATVVEKNQYDAFLNTRLLDVLNENKVQQLVIGGVMTHLCCESTARAAFTRGFEVICPVDLSATYTRDLHLGSCRSLGHGFAHILTLKELLDRMEKDTP